ncbi:MAG: helix-turn-helix domain-containing protein [Bacteroidia bacterium]
MNLGTTIKDIRKQKKLTQNEFASSCGITQTYLSQIETNSKDPKLSVLKAISEKLDVPLPILFFLSLTEDDIQEHKRDAFKTLNPLLKTLLHEFNIVQKI